MDGAPPMRCASAATIWAHPRGRRRAAVLALGAGRQRLGRGRRPDGQRRLEVQGATADLGELARLFPVLRQLPGFVEPSEPGDPQTAQFRLFER